MALREYFGAVWVEFSKAFVEDCRFHFMPWRQARSVSSIRYR